MKKSPRADYISDSRPEVVEREKVVCISWSENQELADHTVSGLWICPRMLINTVLPGSYPGIMDVWCSSRRTIGRGWEQLK
jgi:hypothetical protein